MSNLQIERHISGMPWAILPARLEEITSIFALQHEDSNVTTDSALSFEGRSGVPGRDVRPVSPQRHGNVAVIPVHGVLSQRHGAMQRLFGGVSTVEISDMLRQALADPACVSVLLDIDSPGGGVYGVAELAQEIRAASGKKRIVAIANAVAASAAYWIASAASEVVVTPSGSVGSIGVFSVHFDRSKALQAGGIAPTVIRAGKYKAEGSPFFPLEADARAAMQKTVSGYYEMFVQAIAAGRNCSPVTVREDMGEGRMVLGSQAVALGMADRVATFEQTVSRMQSGAQPGAKAHGRAEIARRRLQLDAR